MRRGGSPRIGAIILAAGASRRMGRPKALLPLEGGTFLEILAGRFAGAGARPILAVLGFDADQVRRCVDTSLFRIVVNPNPDRGQLSSFLCGLDALGPNEVDGVFMAPVDTPRVQVGTIKQMMEHLAHHPLVVPRFEGRRGHPTLFAHTLFASLRRTPQEEGARAVVRSESRRLELDTDDEAVIEDFDHPQDLERLPNPEDPGNPGRSLPPMR